MDVEGTPEDIRGIQSGRYSAGWDKPARRGFCLRFSTILMHFSNSMGSIAFGYF